ncbi:MAG: PIN domain-containing protein [Calditrichaeota bacterium]|nr:PIN domain-containing protein [Calditrichota bacterium]
MEKSFIDTIIIIYAHDKKDPQKQQKAIALLKSVMQNRSGIISTRVLQEYAFLAIKKLKQAHGVVIRQVKLLETLEVINQSADQICRAVEIMHSYQINFWDSCIISNAEQADCSVIFSEDLNAGQFYSGIKIVNPFVS